MPMGIVGKEELAREVTTALGDWTPTQAHEQEAAFQDDLHEYLDARLNAGGGKILDSGGNFVVDRVNSDVDCDVVVSDTIGITVRQDLVADEIKRLAEQVREYQKSYTHVVVIACGSIDDDVWEQLQVTYQDQHGMNNDPGSTPVMFLRRRKVSYGNGKSAADYQQPADTTGESLLEMTVSAIQRRVRRLKR